MKYIVTVARGTEKRAVTIERNTDRDARVYAEKLLLNNSWSRAELYVNDSLTPNMESAYKRYMTCTKQKGKIEWEDCLW